MTTSVLCERDFSHLTQSLLICGHYQVIGHSDERSGQIFLTNCRLRRKLESYLRVQLCVSVCLGPGPGPGGLHLLAS